MNRLSTFSKLLIIIAVVLCGSALVITCNNCTKNQPQQAVYTQPTQSTQPYVDYGQYQVVGPDQVVVVYDEWSGSQFYLSYATWQYLGGYNAAVNYYRAHRYDPDWSYNQSTYESSVSTTINNYYGQNGSTEKYDPNTPLAEKIKYQKSSGFSNPTLKATDNSANTSTTTVQAKSQQSTGFSGSQSKWFNTPDVKPEKPNYEPSTGFSKPEPSKVDYKPSTGFSKPSTATPTELSYKPSNGFKTSKPPATDYKPSSGFSTPKPNNIEHKPSTGFSKKKD